MGYGYGLSSDYGSAHDPYGGYDTTVTEGLGYGYPSSYSPTYGPPAPPAPEPSGSWWSRTWDAVTEWSDSVDWGQVGQGVVQVGIGVGEVIIGAGAVIAGCATVVACGASIAGAYAITDGFSRIVSGGADIWNSRNETWEPESANFLKNGYEYVLGEENGGMAYEIAGALATEGASVLGYAARMMRPAPEDNPPQQQQATLTQTPHRGSN